MAINSIANEIIKLPKSFYDLGTVSIYSLLKTTGYFENYSLINCETILQALNNNPKYAEDWLTWSASKRIESGWYLIKKHNTFYVGHYPADPEINEVEYDDTLVACANFIKSEIEAIRLSSFGW